ncbi:hypothetical protein Nos7524_4579 [Nostoc sp. PCC 7524]|uniref:hypothetical protein n=1 Tax=Nostoc sp. (strain ATCC 29411 / PCC 7524) TaxID=28072 RepID=UPI00029EE7B0|nr:hypothetical protein [Nostoc sp. PCC 7524]AFY50327.1 hypothetical protein Nos7524_4579 [Nostoc sp. PCC 7524]
MQKSFLAVTRLLVASIATIGITSLFTVQPSLAQLGTVDAGGNNADQQNNLDFNSGNFNMFDLIHRATFGTGSWDANRQSDQIDEAAKAFRERQNRARTNNQQQGQTLPLPIIITPSSTQPAVTSPSP